VTLREIDFLSKIFAIYSLIFVETSLIRLLVTAICF